MRQSSTLWMFKRTLAVMFLCTALPRICSITKCAFFVAMRSSSECTSSPTLSIASLPICSSPFSMYCSAFTSLFFATMRTARASGAVYSGSVTRTACVPLPLNTACAWWFATVRGVIFLYTRLGVCLMLMIELYHYLAGPIIDRWPLCMFSTAPACGLDRYSYTRTLLNC